MKRKLVYIGAAWGTGLLCAALMNPALDFLLLPAFLIFLLVFRFLFKGRFKEFILITSAFISALGFYRAYDILVYEKTMEYAGKSISFNGRIKEISDYSGDISRYVLKGRINGVKRAEILVLTDTMNCSEGDYLSFKGTLKEIENSYLFSGRDYYKSNGIYLEANEIENAAITKNSGFSLQKIISRYRESVSSFIKGNLPERESGFLLSMLFADKSGLDENDSDALYGVGIGHVMAVSGLHLMLFSRMVRKPMRRLKLGKTAEFFITELAMLLFSMCCSMPVSVIRTFLMLTIVYSAPLFFRKPDCLNSICIILIIMTLPCPFYILNPSLVLSVAGTWGAGVFAPFVVKRLKDGGPVQKLIKNSAFMLCVYVAVFPASVMFFGEGSLISPVTNMLLTPICMAALMLCMISAVFFFLDPVPLIKASGILCRVVLEISERIYRLSFLRISFNGRVYSTLIICLLVICFSAYFIRKSERVCAVSAAVSFAVFMLFSAFVNFSAGNQMRIALLGENMGVAVISHGHTADVIDLSGERRNGSYVEKYLEESNINRIGNVFICSKPYSTSAVYDHSLKNCKVGNVCLPIGYEMRGDMKICGCIPEYSDYSSVSVQYESFCYRIENGFVYTEYGDFSGVLTGGENTDSQFETNSVLICRKDGRVKAWRLY